MTQLNEIVTESYIFNPINDDAVPTFEGLLLYIDICSSSLELNTTNPFPSSFRSFTSVLKFTMSLYLLYIFLYFLFLDLCTIHEVVERDPSVGLHIIVVGGSAFPVIVAKKMR